MGLSLAGRAYTSDTVLARNFIFGTGVAGISVTGFTFPELEITGNTITPQKGDANCSPLGGRKRIGQDQVASGSFSRQVRRIRRGFDPDVVSLRRM